MILAATRDAARLFLELGTVTVVLAVGARLAARTDHSIDDRGRVPRERSICKRDARFPLLIAVFGSMRTIGLEVP